LNAGSVPISEVVDRVRVLIAGEAAALRQALCEALASDPQIEVLPAAGVAWFATRGTGAAFPDVVVLHAGVPRTDDLAYLREAVARRPVPVIVCAAIGGEPAESALKILEAGAVGVVALPRTGVERFLRKSCGRLCRAVKAAAEARARPRGRGRVVLVGASTGGPEALGVALTALPPGSPGLLVVQHMPATLTAAFARHLDGQCAIEVKEAEDGDPVLPGRALLAPGDRHLLLRESAGRYFAEVRSGPPVCRHRPSVDVLFRSGARCAGGNAVGVLLTGMGSDGARGLLELKRAGASTMAQDESTSAAFAMPQAAIRLGAACEVHPIEEIAPAILKMCEPSPAGNP
jgi:two-component system, chemotaxis family, protein-glutamate methylesterase/glutaminase